MVHRVFGQGWLTCQSESFDQIPTRTFDAVSKVPYSLKHELNPKHPIYISVIGGDRDHTTEEGLAIAEEVGRRIAEAECILVNGGMGGTMERAAKGAKSAGGTTIGILSSTDRNAANSFIDYAIPTPLGFVRNVLVANASDAVIVLPGKWGTSNELSFAMIAGVPVVAIEGWGISTPRRWRKIEILRSRVCP